MKLAILSDIHANLEATDGLPGACQRQGCDEFAFLGDLVGYGADPHACLDIVRRHAENGAIVVRGNHDDAALGGLCEDMNFVARDGTYWTRQQLAADERAFLEQLPYAVERAGRLFVHASAAEPKKWEYIVSQKAAERCLAATRAGSVFVGHVHHPSLYFSVRNQVMAFTPQPGVPVSLTSGRRWLAIVGSVGQPRDGNPAAAYLTFDTVLSQATFFRVPYDCMSAAAKIRAAGLPEDLATRLEHGE